MVKRSEPALTSAQRAYLTEIGAALNALPHGNSRCEITKRDVLFQCGIDLRRIQRFEKRATEGEDIAELLAGLPWVCIERLGTCLGIVSPSAPDEISRGGLIETIEGWDSLQIGPHCKDPNIALHAYNERIGNLADGATAPIILRNEWILFALRSSVLRLPFIATFCDGHLWPAGEKIVDQRMRSNPQAEVIGVFSSNQLRLFVETTFRLAGQEGLRALVESLRWCQRDGRFKVLVNDNLGNEILDNHQTVVLIGSTIVVRESSCRILFRRDGEEAAKMRQQLTKISRVRGPGVESRRLSFDVLADRIENILPNLREFRPNARNGQWYTTDEFDDRYDKAIQAATAR